MQIAIHSTQGKFPPLDTKRKHLTFLNFTFIPQTMRHFQGWSYEKDDKPVNKQFPMQNSKKKKEKLWNSSFLYSCFSLTSVNREHWSYEWRCSTFPLRLKKAKLSWLLIQASVDNAGLINGVTSLFTALSYITCKAWWWSIIIKLPFSNSLWKEEKL